MSAVQHVALVHANTSIAPASPLLSVGAAASYLRCHPRTLAEWRMLGRGPLYVRVGRRAFYRQPDLDQWLEAHVFEQTAHEQSHAFAGRHPVGV